MSKIYNVRFDGAKASIKLVSSLGDEIIIKTLVAKTPDELWNGLLAIDSIDAKGQTMEFVASFNKQAESESLGKAIEDWLSKGNAIKKFPISGKKLVLSEEEEDSIISLVDELDLSIF